MVVWEVKRLLSIRFMLIAFLISEHHFTSVQYNKAWVARAH